jgi:small subunit ribosomal protein S20
VAKRTASAKKQARSGVKRAARNRAVRSEVKTMVVKARRSIAETGGDGAERLTIALEALRSLDRAASKGVLHRNNAARRKGRLARQMAKMSTAAPAPAAAKGKKAAAAAPAAAKGKTSAKPAAKASAKVAAPAKTPAPAKKK